MASNIHQTQNPNSTGDNVGRDIKFEKALNELIEALNVDRGEKGITSFL